MVAYTHTINDITSSTYGSHSLSFILVAELHNEIASSITNFLGINTSGVIFYFHKSTTWSSSNITTLTNVIIAHPGTIPSGGDDVSIQTAVTMIDPGSGSNDIMLTSPDPVTSSYTITFPATVGSSGQVLKTVDGIGTLGWVSGGGDVTSSSNMTTSTLLQGDDGAKGIKDTTITITNNDEIGNLQEINLLQDSDFITKYGYNALAANTGDNNSAFGNLAGSSILAGSDNSAFGFRSIENTTSGQWNTAFGSQSLTVNINGSNNTALGCWSLRNATIGESTAVGAFSLAEITTGLRNTAVGYFSNVYCVTGNDNTSLGHNTLQNNLASTNTAIGTNSLKTNTTGENNISLGSDSLISLDTGDNNIAIGHESAKLYTGVESNNIIIGHVGIVSDNNKIRIGTTSTHNECYIQGIHGVSPGGTPQIVIIEPVDGQLGSTTVAGIDGTAIHDNTASEISTITAKGTPVNADFLLIEDSADSNNKKRITIGDLPVSAPSGTAGGDLGGTYPNPTVDDGADGTAIHDNTASEISAITAKGTPITADFLLIEDSADSNNKKRITIGDLPSTSANVFGNDYQTAISLNRETTGSTTFQNKVALTTGTLTGTYRVGWTSVIDVSNSTQDSVEARLLNVTDSIILGVVQRMEPKDTDNKAMAGGFAEVTFTGSAKTFRIEWREQDGATAGIQDARIEIWRLL